MFPVASAAGRVEELLLKYAPYGQPLIHLFLYWQVVLPRPGLVPSVMCATLAGVTTLPFIFLATEILKSSSAQFKGNGFKNSLSGS